MKLAAPLSVALSCLLAAAAFADPVGMVIHVAGHPQVNGAPLHLLERVESGAVIKCGSSDEAVVVIFDNGARYRVAPGHSGTVGAGGVAGASTIAAVSGPSAGVLQSLAGARVGAVMARPAISHQRLTPQSPAWLPDGTRDFKWTPNSEAAAYSFSIFDQYDNVVWSVRGADTTAHYPDDLPALLTRRPYVWRLVPFGQSGKPLPETRWGVMTFLSDEDSQHLTSSADTFKQLADAQPDDTVALLLLAELYRHYGVLEGTLETLEDNRLKGQDGVSDAIDETYTDISPYARTLARRATPAAE